MRKDPIFDMPKQVDKPLHIITVLDCSSSMSGKKFDAAKRALIKEEQTFPGAFFSLIKVDDRMSTCVVDERKQEYTTTLHANGMTALYDGLVLAFDLACKYPNDNTIIKVYTDGEENHSFAGVSTVRLRLSEIVEKKIPFVFIGTAADVKRMLGIFPQATEANTATHDNTGEGLAATLDKVLASTVSYTKSLAEGTADFNNFFNNKK